jgi:hypothetical protein
MNYFVIMGYVINRIAPVRVAIVSYNIRENSNNRQSYRCNTATVVSL